MSEELHKYGLTFWSGKNEDDEVYTYFYATDYFSAERISEKFNKRGMIKFPVCFVRDNMLSYYTIKTEDYCRE